MLLFGKYFLKKKTNTQTIAKILINLTKKIENNAVRKEIISKVKIHTTNGRSN